MSEDKTREVMQGLLAAERSGGDLSRFLAEDAVWTTVETGEKIRGREAVVRQMRGGLAESFDGRPEIKGLGIADGMAFVEVLFVGTQTGTFAGVVATGASVRITYVVVYDVADQHITAIRLYLSMSTVLRQLHQGASAQGAAHDTASA